MSKPKTVSNRKLEIYIKRGMTPSEIAKKLNLNYHTVYARVNKIKKQASRDLVLYHADSFLARELNSLEQLQHINATANELLNLLAASIMGDEEAKTKALATLGPRLPGDTDAKQLILKCCQEIRSQLGLQFDFFKAMFDMRAVADFQNEVIKAINYTACPECAEKIVNRLLQLRTMRMAVKPEGIND